MKDEKKEVFLFNDTFYFRAVCFLFISFGCMCDCVRVVFTYTIVWRQKCIIHDDNRLGNNLSGGFDHGFCIYYM